MKVLRLESASAPYLRLLVHVALICPQRSAGQARGFYEGSILDRLAVIELGKLAGFELEEIRVLLAASAKGPAAAWRTLGPAKRPSSMGSCPGSPS